MWGVQSVAMERPAHTALFKSIWNHPAEEIGQNVNLGSCAPANYRVVHLVILIEYMILMNLKRILRRPLLQSSCRKACLKLKGPKVQHLMRISSAVQTKRIKTSLPRCPLVEPTKMRTKKSSKNSLVKTKKSPVKTKKSLVKTKKSLVKPKKSLT